MSQRLVQATIKTAAAITVLAAAGLIADYVIARSRAPGDDRRIATLQQQVRFDASLAPVLEAEHKRVTEARDRRKARTNPLSWILIFSAAACITAAKRLIVPRAPSRPEPIKPARLRVATAAMKHASRSGPPALDLAAVDRIVAREGRTAEAAIPILQAIQAHFRYLPDQALARVCELTEITPAQIAGTSSFYVRFRRTPIGEHVVRVCHGTACHVSGARQITEELRRTLAIPDGSDTDPDRQFTIEEVACFGCCSLAPVLMIDEHTVGKLTPANASAALNSARPTEPA